MFVTCPICNLTYDDLDHYTFCPHEYFEPSPDAKKALDIRKELTEDEQLAKALASVKKILTPFFEGFVLICERNNDNGDAAAHLVSWSGGAARGIGLCLVGELKLKSEIAVSMGLVPPTEGEDEG